MTNEETNRKYQEEKDKMLEEYDHIHELIMKTDSAEGVLDMVTAQRILWKTWINVLKD